MPHIDLEKILKNFKAHRDAVNQDALYFAYGLAGSMASQVVWKYGFKFDYTQTITNMSFEFPLVIMGSLKYLTPRKTTWLTAGLYAGLTIGTVTNFETDIRPIKAAWDQVKCAITHCDNSSVRGNTPLPTLPKRSELRLNKG